MDNPADWEVMEDLLKKFRPRLLRLIAAHDLSWQAEDILQEIAYRVWMNRKRRGEPAWDYKVMTATAESTVRDFRRRRPPPESLDALAEFAPPLQDPASNEESLEAADSALLANAFLARLPPAQRKVVELHELEGLTAREIGLRLGRTLKGVQSTLAKGMESLKRIAAEAGLCSPPRPCARRARRRGLPIKVLPCVSCAYLRAQCLPALSVEQKRAFEARYLKRKTLAAVGETLAVAVPRVRALLAFAEATLKAHCPKRTN